jgi:protein-tyrosine-phosphatase
MGMNNMENKSIVFVCEHGAAKSIIAAAYYNKLASDKNLNTRAMARGTHPDPGISQKAVTGLAEDGLAPTESVPQILSPADIELAQHIVAFCEIPIEYKNAVTIETWDDIPPVSDDYVSARNAILKRLHQLMK